MPARYYRELLNFCLRRTRDRAKAEDLAQESMVRVLGMQQSGQAIGNPQALLRQVATRASIDQARRNAVREAEDLDALDDTRQPAAPAHLQPEELLASQQAVSAYLRAIDALPPRCRQAFGLYVFDGLSTAEIAGQMGVSVSMAKKFIQRGKLACAECRRGIEAPDQADGRPTR